jgi:hypothetical protein
MDPHRIEEVTMRNQALLGLAVVLLATGDGIEAAPNRSRCHSVPAQDTVKVTAGGKYENPAGVGGWPGQPGCELAYVVDFDSQNRRMSSFIPDRHWLKTSPAGMSCIGQCRGIEYSRFSAGIDVYRCISKRGCAADEYSKVGQYGVRYGKAILPPRCAALLQPGDAVPKVEDSFGVRMVVKYRYDEYFDIGGPQCQKAPMPVPAGLGINASGTAGFLTLGPLDDDERPKAEPVS